jgi:pilus assembly protein CpaE
VLNKADNRLGIRVENVESNIQHKVALQIANAPHEMTLSVNQGVPMVIGKRDHRASKDIFALARELSRTGESEDGARPGPTPTPPPPAQGAKKRERRGGFLAKLFGRA